MAKIIGNPTVTPMAVPDWNQNDNTKADYIKNKPDILSKDDVINIHKNHTYPVMRAEADAYGNKFHLIYAKKDEIQNNLNIVDYIDNISSDEDEKVIPSAKAVKVHTAIVRNEIIGYVDINVLNKIVNDLTVPVESDAIPTARCTQKYIEDTASEIVTHIETTLENIIEKYGLGGDGA